MYTFISPSKLDPEGPAYAKMMKSKKFDPAKKVAVIKEIKNIVEGMNLVQAKKFVESAPAVVKTDITKEEADKIKETLSALGGECTVE